MRKRWFIPPAASVLLFLPSCSNIGGSLADHPSGTGPFDARGNYVEAWADNPSQWRRSSQPQVRDPEPDAPVLASNTPPPPVVTPSPRPVSTTTTVINTRPQQPRTPTTTASKPKPAVTSAAVQKPKPKPVASKPAPKPSSSSRHTVRKGDTLYGIAKRYGTSVTAIQKANRMSGTVIRPGQSLVIPR